MDTITKWILTIGTKDKDNKKEILAAGEKIIQTVLNSGIEGSTQYETIGTYKHITGEVIQEKSIRCEILFEEMPKIKELVNNLKIELNQESIAVELIETQSELW